MKHEAEVREGDHRLRTTHTTADVPSIERIGLKQYYMIGMLTLVYVVGFLDRQIINILAEEIKLDLRLADWQVGVLTGFSFALLYTVLGIPAARFAERTHRPRLIAAALATWSIFTALCGLAQNFMQLALARFGVGVGEAGCTPPAHSLISDSVPPSRRASAISIYSLGIPLGTLLGMALGGIIADSHGWRTAFFAVSVPGLILATILVMTISDPRSEAAEARHDVPTFAESLRELRAKPAFRWITAAATLKGFVTYGQTAFLGSFFLRMHADGLAGFSASFADRTGIELGNIGILGVVLGLSVGLAGAFGTLVGGAITDRFLRRDLTAYVTVPAYTCLVSVPFVIAALFVASPVLAIILFAMRSFFVSAGYGPSFASVQGVVHRRSRATASAVLLFVINLLGLGFGPVILGLISDLFSANGMSSADGLRYALLICESGALVAVLCYLRARRTFRSDWVG